MPIWSDIISHFEVSDIHAKFETVIFRLIDLVIFAWLFNVVIFKFNVKLSKWT